MGQATFSCHRRLVDHTLTALRTCVNRQQPFGTIDWQLTTAATLDLTPRDARAGGHEHRQKSSLSPFLLPQLVVLPHRGHADGTISCSVTAIIVFHQGDVETTSVKTQARPPLFDPQRSLFKLEPTQEFKTDPHYSQQAQDKKH